MNEVDINEVDINEQELLEKNPAVLHALLKDHTRTAHEKKRASHKERKVGVSSAIAGGQKRDSQLAIIDNRSAFGRSRVALGSFKINSKTSNLQVFPPPVT